MSSIQINKKFKELLAPLTSDEYQSLEESIINDGCRDPLVIGNYEGQSFLIDGHNRYRICQAHNISFDTIHLDFDSEQDAFYWIIKNQLGRRNVTPDQATYLWGKRYEGEKKEQGAPKGNENAKKQKHQNDVFVFDDEQDEDKPNQDNEPETTAEKLAKEYKVSKPTIERASKYAQAIDTLADLLGEHIRDEILTRDSRFTKKDVIALAKEIDNDPETVKAVVEMIREGKAKNMKSALREIIKENKSPVEMPVDNKYRVIYADPPWQYGNNMPDYFTEQADYYSLMTMDDICNMPIKDIAEDNAVLFLWVTSPILEDAFKVINSWGFKYKASFVWDKVKHNMGHYNSVRHEFLLICVRGSCQPDVRKLFDSVQSIERTPEHSEKPEKFREIIDHIYPNGKRIELFSRHNIDGWDRFGNELLS